MRPVIITDIYILPINHYDNLNFSFVNLSQVLKGLFQLFLLTVFNVLFASMEMISLSFKSFWQTKSSCFQLKFEHVKTFSDTRLVLRLCM